MHKKLYSGFLLIALVLVLHACRQSDNASVPAVTLRLPATPYNYTTDGSSNHIPTLGRVLFYDARLSANNSVSCATCHHQARAFADGSALSIGFHGVRTTRNAMPIQNLTQVPSVFFTNNDSAAVNFGNDVFPGGRLDTLSLFWDGREKVLDKMVLMPITNHVEMGINDLVALTEKLKTIPEYNTLFSNAYGDAEITQVRIADALGNFLSRITSSNSRFDGQFNGVQLTSQEMQGESLFLNKYNCNSCHQVFALNGYELGGGDGEDPGFINIGLDQHYADPGHAEVTRKAADNGRFKIPTLRNVALTGPYMHDGRFNSLSEVIDHYSSGIKDHPSLDSRLRSGSEPIKMNISEDEKQAIIAFLGTMTDYQMVTDPKFSNPFVAVP